MYKNGLIKIQLSTPNLKIGNPQANAFSINKILQESKALFILFPELCLSGYTAGDLFFETFFLKENLKALDWLLKNNTFEGVFILGMPLALHEVLFNVAVVIQKDKILGIIPKKTIPNYKEFMEKRWFQSGKTVDNQQITILGQEVPFGDILFVNSKHDIIFGVEVCQDLWTVFSPSDLMALNGAHLIFNLSSSTEHVGKINPRKIAILDHSRKQIGGYFYASSGITEITESNLFSNHKMAASLGQMIGEKNLFNQDINLIVDLDLDFIKYQRRIDTTYGDQRIGNTFPFLKAFFQTEESSDYHFESPISQTPFINQDSLQNDLELANEIQKLALKTKLQDLDTKVILEITENINDFVTFMVLLQTFSLLQKPLADLIIILNPISFQDLSHYQLLKTFIQEQGVVNFQEKGFSNQTQFLSFLSHNQLLKETDSQTALLLENNNFSELALGQMSQRGYYDYLYNVNSGLPHLLIKELIFYHLKSPLLNHFQPLKLIYQQKAQALMNTQIIIEDFILFHHLKNGHEPNKIAWLLQIVFNYDSLQSQTLVFNYLKRFFQSQFKRQNMSPGPKILENSLCPRGESRLPVGLKR
ncbi:NAD(+) synthetase [Candidatus Phytoplasma australiense]|uniref:Glutamine-dependent NAD(+) synthetase n=1 Tax=Phytoplasma australiense TaxID=59748 RepID=B1VAX4_PHYAS|nr:NAD(+) synthetase [Candidatus Phytoplasma australiense]